jgi:FkbM family methyltransferase
MNQDTHWDYTVNEWESKPFFGLLKEAFKTKTYSVWDVGACTGAWSYVVAKHFGKQLQKNQYLESRPRFVCFEPDIDNYDYASGKEWDVPAEVEFVNAAVWYGATPRANWDSENVGSISLINGFRNSPRNGEIHTTTLEEYSVKIPDLLKLDVEGAEKNIIENSPLLTTVPQLLIEWHYQDEDAVEFFSLHLPHKIVYSMGNAMFLLKL